MTTHRFYLTVSLLSAAMGMSLAGAAFFVADEGQLPPTYVPSGKQMYRQYCAACHGSDGRGRGPAAPALSKQPPDLTTLAKRHAGKFPEDYVTSVLRFGPGFSAHGSSEMPVWGPIFQYIENYNEAAVRQRIRNLCDYLESMQER
jgi:mono/diheme cytochrome c family protein